MPEVSIPSTLRKLTGERAVVVVDGDTVAETLADLERQFPGFGERVLDDGKVRRFVNIYVGDEDIRFLSGLDTKIAGEQRVAIIPAVAGGSFEAPAPLDVSGTRTLRVGLLGCGTVGAPVAKALLEDGDHLCRAAGVNLELVAVAVAHPGKARPVDLPVELITTDALAVAIDPGIDIVIEVIGGIEPAGIAIKGALGDNKTVITANKELLAGSGASLLDDPANDLFFEAAVCGAIPIVRTLKEYCAGDRIESFIGILSGTCNFALSEMTSSGCSLETALARARSLGYAEADVTSDVEAFDAAAKLAILCRIAFGVGVSIDEIDRTGITGIDRHRIAEAKAEGHAFKLIAGARRLGRGIEAWVRPVLVGPAHPFADVDGADNALSIETERAGQLRFHGRGAGGDPTAAAILGDLATAVRRRIRNEASIPCVA